MGICSSCLGRGRRDDYEEINGRDDERLLFDDPNAITGYGSFDQHPVQEDHETQREMESLQRVVAKTAQYVCPLLLLRCPSNRSPTVLTCES
jgi:hypothetical protein